MNIRPLIRSIIIAGVCVFSVVAVQLALIDPFMSLGLSGHKALHFSYYLGAFMLIFIASRYLAPGLIGELMNNSLNRKMISICIYIGFGITIMTVGLIALQIYVVYQVSESEALGLWEFQSHNNILGYNEDVFGKHLHNSFFTALSLTLAAPLLEEVYFRKIILSDLKKTYGLVLSVILSSILWTLGHSYNIWLHIFVNSIIISTIFLITNNIWCAIIVHGSSNLMGWIFEGFFGSKFIENKNVENIGQISEWRIEFTALAASTVFIIFLIKKLRRNIDDRYMYSSGI